MLLNQKGIAHILVLIILLFGIVAGLFLLKHPQIFKSKASVNGPKIEFIGSNVSGDSAFSKEVRVKLTYSLSGLSNDFNMGVNIPAINDLGVDNIDSDLQKVKQSGGKIIRIFVANREIDTSETARRLNLLLDKASSNNISVIVSLIDFYGGPWDHRSVITVYNNTACPGRNTPLPDISGSTVTTCKGETISWDQVERELIGANYASYHAPSGMSQYYDINWNQTALLGHDFFSGGYKGVYKNFVQGLVNSTKNHSNIFAWEIGNELKDDSSKQTFLAFMQDMSTYIKSLDPNHKISSGLISASHPGFNPGELYSNLPNIDIITIHTGVGDHSGVGDITWANQNNKTAIVEEFGYSAGNHNLADLQSEVSFWKNAGAKAVLFWDFGDYLNFPQESFPSNFRIANSQNELSSAATQAFDGNPKESDWTLSSGNGQKTVYAQFKVNGSWENPISADITLAIPSVSPSSSAQETVVPSSSPSPSPSPSATLSPTTIPTSSPSPSPSSSPSSSPKTTLSPTPSPYTTVPPTAQIPEPSAATVPITTSAPTSSSNPSSAIALITQRREESIRKLAPAEMPQTTPSPQPSQENTVARVTKNIPVLGGIFTYIIDSVNKTLNFWKGL